MSQIKGYHVACQNCVTKDYDETEFLRDVVQKMHEIYLLFLDNPKAFENAFLGEPYCAYLDIPGSTLLAQLTFQLVDKDARTH